MAKTTDIIVNGQIDICVPLELPSSKKELKKLALDLGLTGEASLEDVAKQLIIDAVLCGLDNMKHRQSCENDVSERDLEIEIQD